MHSPVSTADCARYRHGLAGYCVSCSRWADLELARLVMRGLGDRPLRSLPLRGRDCGGRGELQVRPPVPKWDGASWSAVHEHGS